jgi:hypothetical protein
MSGRTKTCCKVEATFEEASEKISRKAKVKFNLELPKVPIGIELEYGKTKNPGDGTDQIIFYACHFKYKKCSLDQIPHYLDSMRTAGGDKKGDSFVQSLWAYTGYKVVFEVRTKWKREKSESDFGTGGKFGCKYFSFESGIKSLSQKLENREIIHIQGYGDGFGDYSIPKMSAPESSIKGIFEALEAIQADFEQKSAQITTFECVIDEDCLGDYSLVPSSHPAPIPAIPSIPMKPSSLSVSQATLVQPKATVGNQAPPKTTKPESFVRLAKEMAAFNKNKLQKILGDVHPASLLGAIKMIFPIFFERGFKSIDDKNYTLVLGSSAEGKSTFIGYMLKAGIIYDHVKERRKVAAIYKSNEDDKFPEIGHGPSETK